MPRRAKGPRLYLKKRRGRAPVYIIRDGEREEVTGCGPDDIAGAQQRLAVYISAKYEPQKTGGQLDKTFIGDVMALYLKEHAPTTSSLDFIKHTAKPVIVWWGAKPLSQVNRSTCSEYLKWRMKQGVTDQTARHDLKTLRAGIKYYHASQFGPLTAVPVVTMPPKKPAREDYWLTRTMAAQRIRAARRRRQSKHMIRMMLIGFYSGTRPGAIKRLRWLSSTDGGWFDLETLTMHRRGGAEKVSRKVASKCRIHDRLLPWLRRWKAADEKLGITRVIHYYGRPIKRTDSAWAAIAGEAGHAVDTGRRDKDGCVIWKVTDGPHIMRHSAATWQMQAGTDPYEAAGYLGMSVDTLLEVYGHHHPDFQVRAASADRKRKAPAILGRAPETGERNRNESGQTPENIRQKG